MNPMPADRAAEQAQRDADLERARRKRAAVKVKQGWRKSVGRIDDTPLAREAFALGEEYRRSQKEP